MSFSSLLAGYAKSKSEPPIESKKIPPPPKSHPLQSVLVNIKENSRPFVASPKISNADELNLGILVLIIDDCPNELLWRLWLEHVNEDGTYTESSQVRIWFHAKCPEKVRSPWVRERLVRGPSFKPEWGSIEITKAMAHMLHEALVDAPHIHKFCFASESCIPIRPLQNTLQYLYSTDSTTVGDTSTGSEQAVYDVDSSWLFYSHIPNNGYAQQLQHDPLARALPPGCVFKASQWALLSRTHAQAVVALLQQVGRDSGDSKNNKHTGTTITDSNGTSTAPLSPLPELSAALFRAFALVVKASDEMFLPSCLAVLGAIPASEDSSASGTSDSSTTATTTATEVAEDAPVAASVLRRQVTYCDWTDNAKSPLQYSAFPTALVTALTAQHHLHTAATEQSLAALHIHPEQTHACFLRKIKFPVQYLQSSGGADGTTNSGEVVWSEAQELFLRDWLPFIVSSNSTSSGGGVENSDTDGSSVATNTSTSTVDRHLQRAQALLCTITRYAAPARPTHKRPLHSEEESSGGSGVTSNGGGTSGGDGRHHKYSNSSSGGRYDSSSGRTNAASNKSGSSYSSGRYGDQQYPDSSGGGYSDHYQHNPHSHGGYNSNYSNHYNTHYNTNNNNSGGRYDSREQYGTYNTSNRDIAYHSNHRSDANYGSSTSGAYYSNQHRDANYGSSQGDRSGDRSNSNYGRSGYHSNNSGHSNKGRY